MKTFRLFNHWLDVLNKIKLQNHLNNYGTVAVTLANEVFDRMIRKRLGVVTVASLYPIMMELGSLDSSRKITSIREKISQIKFIHAFVFFEKKFVWESKHGHAAVLGGWPFPTFLGLFPFAPTSRRLLAIETAYWNHFHCSLFSLLRTALTMQIVESNTTNLLYKRLYWSSVVAMDVMMMSMAHVENAMHIRACKGWHACTTTTNSETTMKACMHPR